MSDGSDLRPAARALAAARRGAVHPPAEELVAYAAGSLPKGRHDEVQEHLAACAECARLLVDFTDFDEPVAPDGVEPLTDAGVAAARARFDALLGEATKASPPRPAAIAPVSRPPAAPAPARTWRLLAAVLAAAVVGLTVWGVGEHLSLRRLRQPEVNVATHDLEPEGGDQVRGGPAAGPTVVDGSAGSAILILQLPGVEDHSEFRVAILDSDSHEVWSRSGAALDQAFSNFTLRLPSGALAPGRYSIEIYGVEAGGRESRLARYPIEVR